MALIIDGIMQGRAPLGPGDPGGPDRRPDAPVGLVPALAFAVGVYLPLSTSMPIFVGGMVRALVDRVRRSSAAESDSSPAVLLSSGYIAGGAIAGIGIALLALLPDTAKFLDQSTSGKLAHDWVENPWISLGVFGVMIMVLLLCGLGVLFRGEPTAQGRALSQAEVKGMSVREEDL